MTIQIHTRRSKWAARVGAALLATSLVATASMPARASLLPEEVEDAIDFVERALKPFQGDLPIDEVIDFLFGSGPDLADQLAAVEQRLIQEIRFWVLDVNLRARTDAAFKKYNEMLRNPNQTTLNRERVQFLTGASSSNDAMEIFLELERLIWDGSVETKYQLAAPFNTLATMMGSAMVYHDRYFPEEPAFSWLSFHDHFDRTLNADYQLVGAQSVQCWPGFNPGRGQYTREHKTRTSSVLYKKITNKSYPVATFICLPISSEDPWDGRTYTARYNPVTRRMAGAGCSGSTTSANVRVENRSFETLSSDALALAQTYGDLQATIDFANDKTAQGVRKSIGALMAMSGGDSHGAMGDPAAGQFFDPIVFEPNFCGPLGPYAYISQR